MNKVIVTVAVNGSRPTKAMNPAVPYTPAEIADAAVEAHRAGAAIAHIHVRDPESGTPSSRLELFAEVLDRIRSRCDMLVNLTTSGLHVTGQDALEQRLAPVQLRPDLCSLDIGSLNFRDRLFANPPEFGEEAARRMQAAGVKPEIEVFDVGHIDQALDLIGRGLIEPPPYFQLCMGVKWGIPATPENLLFMRSKLPADAQWSVLGVGAAQWTMVAMGVLLGGHVRVGFEDNLHLRKGVLARSNAELVEQAVRIAQALQREVATPAEARAMLHLSGSF
ncbi:3-keto-5-aminohexanoate cleavage protein [Caldilinea sp.]|jgi:3-keto-5-aminohexanoate cleavage enzyme|uniref:3-keto-5-aminohexanoate cleavage protein n=1 Tax=Caldilinea sp. TaxID=2293560 RepID=UPI0021DEC4CB|nr:3-keto-5-aminohexanoate cleavage protein [Caldilinea sp.]GIV67932.1 MAG: 3-keto-5-aminohexanoate cleavage protein [Caldilinea sp.]